jgi:hypothetical protein
VKIRIAEGQVPLGMEGISDGLQDRGLGRITFANQAEDVGVGEAPVKFFHASKVLDFYFSDLH